MWLRHKTHPFLFSLYMFGGDISWTKTGITHLGHSLEKIKKHENSIKHLQNEVNLNLELCKNLDVSLRSHFENSKVFKGT